MRSLSRLRSSLLLSLIAGVVVLAGCGDTKRSGDGVALTFSKWASPSAATNTCPPQGGQSGVVIPLSEGLAQEQSGDFGTTLIAVLTNNLAGEAIRLDRIHHRYHVAGTSDEIPETSASMPGFIAAQGSNFSGQFGEDSTLPDSLSGGGSTTGGTSAVPSVACNEVLAVPASIRTYLNFNRDSLPDRPFEMVIESYVTGVTTGGSRVNSNSLYIDAVVTEDNLILPMSSSSGTTGAVFADDTGVTTDAVTLTDDETVSEEEAETSSSSSSVFTVE